LDVRDHWERVYQEKDLTHLSWYQDRPDLSISFISRAGVDTDSRILDVGAGTSSLVDHLLLAGFPHLGVLDVSPTAVDITRRRLGHRARSVEWFVADVTEFAPPHPWDVWHDRAVLHFLTEDDDRSKYRRSMESSVAEHGAVVLSTFGPEGPLRCSGLNVRRYDVHEMCDWIGPDFSLAHHEMVDHATPERGVQQFLACLFLRTRGAPQWSGS